MIKGTTSSYRLYRRTALEERVDITQYRDITNKYLLYLVNKLKENGQVKLPLELGTIVFEGKKIKIKFNEDGEVINLPVDWKLTKEFWNEFPEKKSKEYIYYDNDHTNGVRYKFKWKHLGNKLKFKRFYTFVSCRALKRDFAKLIKEEKKEYMVHE